MKQVVRVQTLYSFKKKDGSLIPRGTYSADAPGGIPEVVIGEAMKGKSTVRVLEWREVPEPEKAKAEKPVIDDESEEDTSEESEEETEEEPEEVTKKPKTARRKRT